jgi:hypothetical protein
MAAGRKNGFCALVLTMEYVKVCGNEDWMDYGMDGEPHLRRTRKWTKEKA